MPTTLYVVTTPIGNLEDLSPRAARVLGEVALIAAEDTRRARKLLSHLGLRTRTLSYNQHNTRQRTLALLEALRTGDVALVTDAGAPGVSDPGASLAAEAAAAGFRVVAVPGPSAVTAALSVAGLQADAFHFLGFLPRTARARRAALAKASPFQETLVLFEAPHRLGATLADALAILGNRRIAVCRELTKLHEEVFRGTITDAIAHFAEPRGEFVLVIEGATDAERQAPPDKQRIAEAMTEAHNAGLSHRDAATKVAQDLGIPRRQAYAAWPEG